MKQTLFATRQRAEELIKEVTTIWRQSYQKNKLDGIESDPVFALLMTALAYQSNEIDDDIERLKSDIWEEFSQMLIPYELCRPIPATVLLKSALQKNVTDIELNSAYSFTLANTAYSFIPLLKTKVVNGEVKSVVRLDGRRWKVSMVFRTPVKNLSGVTFHVANASFHDLKVVVDSKVLPLIKPWDYSNLPLSDCFSIDSMLYNRGQTYNASAAWFDLFAQQNARVFIVDKYEQSQFKMFETEQIDFIFEFFGIDDNFVFDKTLLHLNCVPLVNVDERSVDISLSNPIVCVSDSTADIKQEFLHLIRPTAEQIYGQEIVFARKVNADRFNMNGLIKLANCIINKFSSDFYAYQSIHNLRDGSKINQLYSALKAISDEVNNQQSDKYTSGTYLMLEKQNNLQSENASLTVKYLTTSGSLINKELDIKSQFISPPGFDPLKTVQIIEPTYGRNELEGVDAHSVLSQYYMVTNDRLVTPTDIKMFCYKELMIRYGIVSEMIEYIKVGHRQQIDRSHCGYEIVVDIKLIDSVFIKRSFMDKIIQGELVLQKMIEVRSTGIYPVEVSISVGQTDSK